MRHVKRMVPLVVVALLGTTYGFSGGDGSPENPYQIASVADLLELYDFDPNNGNNFLLTADIDLDPLVTGLEPFNTAVIARDVDRTNTIYDGQPFTGVFDGGGHTISNLTIISGGADNDYLGLFGKLKYGQILNLHLENVTVTGGNASRYIGGLMGRNYRGDVINCTASGSVTAGDNIDYLGGLVGFNSGIILNCFSTGSVTGGDNSDYLGGLVGRNCGVITNCSASSSLTGDDYLGCLVGLNIEGIVCNCYATGSVVGDNSLGGLVGRNYSAITNCYAAGGVTGGSYLGGLVGRNDNGSITHSYFLHPNDGGGPINGIGEPLTDAQMRQQDSFVDWDFYNETANGTAQVWVITSDGGYPVHSVRVGYCLPMPPGSGTSDDPYLLNDPDDLGAIYYHPSACCKLTEDIDLAGITWSHAPIPAFSGHWDGQGHTIRNLHIQGGGHLGLFGRLIKDAIVTDIRLENMDISGGVYASYLGGLAGCNEEGMIDNCSATGRIIGGNYSRYLGGLVGRNYSTINNSSASSSVSGIVDSYYIGGLVGFNGTYGKVVNCYAEGNVTGYYYLGGLVGQNWYGTISCSYAIDNISGRNVLGGLLGYNFQGVIINSYATGNISGGQTLGGLVGGIDMGTIANSYATGSVMGDSYLGGLVGRYHLGSIVNSYFLHPSDGGGPINGYGTVLKDEQMRWQVSFVGWDFVGDDNGVEDHWQMCIDGFDYPRLAWQFSIPGDFINPGRVDNYDLYVITNDRLSVSSRCGDIAPPDSPDGVVNLLDYAEFSRHWLDVSLFGANQIHQQIIDTLSEWTPPQLVLAWNANPRILVPYVTADKLTMYYSRYHEDQWQILHTHRDDPADPFPVGQVIPELVGGFCPWLSADGLRMYYNLDDTGDQIMHLAERTDPNSPWQHVRALTEINAAGIDDNSPCVTADELTIFWSSYRYVGPGIAASLWTATRSSTSEPFSGAINLSELNLHAHNSTPCIMPDGLTIYFLSCDNHPSQFYKATRNSLQEPFGNIQALRLTDGTPFDGHAPFVTPDEQDIYFYSEWMGVGEGICVSHYQP